MPVRFFTAPDGGVTTQLRRLCNVPDGNKLVLLDIPADGKYYVFDPASYKGTMGPGAVKAFLAGIKDGSVERHQMKPPGQ